MTKKTAKAAAPQIGRAGRGRTTCARRPRPTHQQRHDDGQAAVEELAGHEPVGQVGDRHGDGQGQEGQERAQQRRAGRTRVGRWPPTAAPVTTAAAAVRAVEWPDGSRWRTGRLVLRRPVGRRPRRWRRGRSGVGRPRPRPDGAWPRRPAALVGGPAAVGQLLAERVEARPPRRRRCRRLRRTGRARHARYWTHARGPGIVAPYGDPHPDPGHRRRPHAALRGRARRAPPAGRWWSSRRRSGSTTTSRTSPVASRPPATTPWRPTCSTAPVRPPSATTTSPWSSPTCCP